MNGAESLVRTLVAGGVEVCFTNPGTSEMHFVAALDKVPGMRSSLCLFEGGATGAADGYFRMARKPASTLLHLGPGLANGIANLHNAKKARSGIVNIVGEHATYHLALDAPLTADIEGLARPVSHWVKTSLSSAEVGQDGSEAIVAARTAPGQIATLILPGDTAWETGGNVANVAPMPELPGIDSAQVDRVAQALRRSENAIILVGNAGLDPETFNRIAQIAQATDCALMTDWANARVDRGAGRISAPRIPFNVDLAIEALRGFDTIILIGARKPVAFFAYPGKPGEFAGPGTTFIELAGTAEDIPAAVDALLDATGAATTTPKLIAQSFGPEIPVGPLDPDAIGAVIGATLPEGAIVVDESVTTGRGFFPVTSGAPPHTWLYNCGGSIGFCLPVATGAAMACPDRKVVALTGDGSAMYTLQSLWTMARENLDVTIMVFANQSYHILTGELTNVGVKNPGPRAADMLSLRRPDLGWVRMSKGLGVDAVRVETTEELARAFRAGLSENGPYLIEVVL
ncbi:MAG: acetolactate synthase large subunit [Silicimonas sp.]|nr:acetolactate synthase large subunit [Silicimonas sp.]